MINWQPYITHLSASQIRNLLVNPRRWALEKLEKLPTATSPAAGVGRMIHEAIEAHINQSPLTGEHSLASHLISSLMDEGTLLKVMTIDGLRVEHPIMLAGVDGLPPIKGFIDVYVPNWFKNCPLIIDHKTSKTRKYFLTIPEMKNDIQLMIYAYWAMLQDDSDGVFIQHNQLAYTLKRQPLVVRRTFLSKERILRFMDELTTDVRAVLAWVIALWEDGKLPSVDNCIQNQCAERFGPNSCEFACLCKGKCNSSEYSKAFESLSAAGEEPTSWELNAMFDKKRMFPSLTKKTESVIIEIKEVGGNEVELKADELAKDLHYLSLSTLVGKARPQVSDLPSVWDRREAITAAVVKHVVGSGAKAVIAPSHFGGQIDPDYLPIITQLKEKGIIILSEV